MQIEERAVGDVVVLDLKGKMTLGEGDELLKDKVNSLVNQGRKKIVLNLADVPYIDSAGLGEIVRTYTTVSRQGGSLKLLNLTKRITDLAVDHEAADRVRDLRLGGRRGPELFGVGQGLSPSSALDGAQHFSQSGGPRCLRCQPRYRAVRLASNLFISLRPGPVDEEPAGLRRARLRRAAVRPGRGRSRAFAAFVIFCALSGVVYLVNDVADRESDRQHPLKSAAADRLRRAAGADGASRRPRSSRAAALAAAFALELALRRSSPSPTWRCWRCTPGRSKHIVIIDVLTIAIGFVLRAVAGAVAVDVDISHWLLVCTILLALFIALAKRRHELVLLADGATSHRPILGEYSPYLLDQMIAVVTASTLIAYIFYTISPETRAEVRHRLARPDDSVSAVRDLPLPLSGAPARGRRQPRRPAADRPAAAGLRRALGRRGRADHL